MSEQRAVVLVTSPLYDEAEVGVGDRLRAAGLEIRFAPKVGVRPAEKLVELLDGAVAALASTDTFDEFVLTRAPRLRVIARGGVGADAIDVTAATHAGIVVTTTRGAHEGTVADHALALMLAACRKVVANDRSVRAGAWERAGTLTGRDLQDAIVGLVGYGPIGQAVARRLRGFTSSMLVCDPALTLGEGFELVGLDELLERSFIVSLHLPLTDATRGLIGRRELGLMRSDAILVNTSRGELIDEVALAAALASGTLASAALDVFAVEPPSTSPLMGLGNVILTPHIAGISVESSRRIMLSAADAVCDVLEGRVPQSVLNPDVFGHPRFHTMHTGA